MYFGFPARNSPVLNYSNPNMPSLLTKVVHNVTHTPFLVPTTVAFWYTDFLQYLCLQSTTVGNGCLDLAVVNRQTKDASAIFKCNGLTATHIPDEYLIPLLKQFLTVKQCCKKDHYNSGICGFQYNTDVSFGTVYQHNDRQWYPFPSTSPIASKHYIVASRIRIQTVLLSESRDYISALKASYVTTDYINRLKDMIESNVSVYPYSLFFAFYEQYLTLPNDALKQVGTAVAAVFIVSLLIVKSLVASLIIIVCLLMILINLIAYMVYFNININAISVVNLVMCIGISVEFCVHITLAFRRNTGSVNRRAIIAMTEMGANVVCGILITKLLGVSVLSFSNIVLFTKYYYQNVSRYHHIRWPPRLAVPTCPPNANETKLLQVAKLYA